MRPTRTFDAGGRFELSTLGLFVLTWITCKLLFLIFQQFPSCLVYDPLRYCPTEDFFIRSDLTWLVQPLPAPLRSCLPVGEEALHRHHFEEVDGGCPAHRRLRPPEVGVGHPAVHFPVEAPDPPHQLRLPGQEHRLQPPLIQVELHIPSSVRGRASPLSSPMTRGNLPG